MMASPKVTESYLFEDISISSDSKPSSSNTESLKQEENNRTCTGILSDSNKEHKDMDVKDCSVISIEKKEKCQYVANNVQVGKYQETKIPSVQNYSESEGIATAVKVRNLLAQGTGFITFLLQ